MDDIKPCHSCGFVGSWIKVYGYRWQVVCDTTYCRHHGPNRGTLSEAVEAWNAIQDALSTVSS
jgi:hypothetical protein